jgi:ATP-dependent Lon protease
VAVKKLINTENIEHDDKRMYNVIPLRRMLIAPRIIAPVLVGREVSLEAVEQALINDKRVFCTTQKEGEDSDGNPQTGQLYRVGTVCQILQSFRLPDGNIRLLVEGLYRAKVKRFITGKKLIRAYVEKYDVIRNVTPKEMEAYLRNLKTLFKEYIALNNSLPEEMLQSLETLDDPIEVFYFVLTYFNIDVHYKHYIFKMSHLNGCMKRLLEVMNEEIEVSKLEQRIEGKVKRTLNKMQREYYLQEQLKIIHKELGLTDDDDSNLIKLKERIDSTTLSKQALDRVLEEMKHLQRMAPQSQEYGVVLNYINWILDLPWDLKETEEVSLKQAREILDNDHYGLTKVKERILEFISVIKLSKKVKGQIICFVGPPGVGKTSLGRSIAKALGRDFIRISLGGVRDEAEIRGHRRTYIGAIPGIIIQSMKKAGSMNPLIMMDEIDKMSTDFRGDPASALLEVLDPEQNNDFRDHYLDFGYDLSKVMFITTANSLGGIPGPLMDRMELIRIPGYTQYEKLNIARKHLLPKQIIEHNIGDKVEVSMSDAIIERVISNYTREAGVRELERQLAQIIRKVVRRYVEGELKDKLTINHANLKKYLGIPLYTNSDANDKDTVGVVTGLAWTSVGGETLQIEVVKMPGNGKVKLTGKLGDVMKESAMAALSYARLHSKEYGINPDFYKKEDIHLHIPEGAIPKDGPSAGVTIATAFISILSGKKVRHNVAMTGEITLTGLVLPIGGLPEKLIAAKRAGIKKVIIPEKNRINLEEIPEEIKKDLELVFASRIEDVLKEAIID